MLQPYMWIYHPRLKKRVRIPVPSDEVRTRKLKRFAQTILELPGIIGVGEATKLGGIRRETARKYLSILKNGRLLHSVKVRYNGHRSREMWLVGGATQIEYLVMFVRLCPDFLAALPRIVDALSSKPQSDPNFWHCERELITE